MLNLMPKAGSNVAPSITTTVDNCMLVCCYSDDENLGSASNPTGMTSRTVQDVFVYESELSLGGAGATGTKTFPNYYTPIGAWSVALAPVVAKSPPPTPNPYPRIWRIY